jgi:hypothetical protein
LVRRHLLNITDLNPNVAHILEAVAGLYLALAAFWLYAAFNDKYGDTALLTAILFAGGSRRAGARRDRAAAVMPAVHSQGTI